MNHSLLPAVGAALAMAAVATAPVRGSEAQPMAPSINTWLVAGTYENDAANAGYERDWIGEESVQPRLGADAAGQPWRFFDDRLFSRNLDDYQDLFSYFRTKRGESVAAKVAYAHVYVHSETEQAAEIRLSADNEFKAWLNGRLVASSTKGTPYRDSVKGHAALRAGWNRLLVKVANQEDGRFGFTARLCDAQGGVVPGLTTSVNGGQSSLAVSTQAMPDAQTGSLPVGYREWPYVGADPMRDPDPDLAGVVGRKPHLALRASDFALTAQGGEPPYRWSLARGSLPRGLRLLEDGRISGVVAASARLGEHRFTVKVADRSGRSAEKALAVVIRERPNRWYEEARLVALMHNPESMLQASDADLAEFARLMRRQGYGLGMMISYNNGDMKYRWPSRYEPDNPLGDLAGRYKAALEAEGIRFGMYMGNLIGPNHGGDNGAILMVEEAMRRYQPAALWFDWASADPDGYVSLDALYSMVRSISPDTLIVLNGVITLYHGDWDVVCLEGWGAWGDRMWSLWPFPVKWPKRVPVESWRMLADPAFEYSKGVQPDWQEYLRVQISLIGAGFVANLDHSPTIRTPYKTLYESPVMQAHRRMAEWANPPGKSPLYESYTRVNPGPIAEAPWGYSTVSLDRTALYLHLMVDPMGKTGVPREPGMTVGPVASAVKSVRWLNGDRPLRFEQKGTQVTLYLDGVVADPVDTILKLQLAAPLPQAAPARGARPEPAPPGNLATGKPARLLSLDGSHSLVPSGFAFARYGVDGVRATHAQGAFEWAWTYHVDLERAYPVRRVVIHFAHGGYATHYRVLLSADGSAWTAAADVTGCKGGTCEHAFEAVPARYVRVQALKPDGPDQEGAQMGIAELEVYR